MIYFLLSAIVISLFDNSHCRPRAGLFFPADQVAILNNKILKDFIFKNDIIPSLAINSYRYHPKAHSLVLFYHSYCGHCQQYAPKFRIFASEIAEWSHVLKIGVKDCAAVDSRELCREFKANKFPLLKFFESNATKPDDAYNMKAYQDSSQLKKQILQKLKTLLPILLPVSNYKKAFKHHKGILLQERNGFLSQQTIIEFSKTNAIDYLRWFNSSTQQPETVDIYTFNNGENNLNLQKSKVTDLETLKEDIVDILRKSFKIEVSVHEKRDFSGVIAASKEEDEEPVFIDMPDHIHTIDMESAIYKALVGDVGFQEKFAKPDLDILAKFLRVLVKYFKTGDAFIKGLENIKSDLLKFEDANEMSAENWKNIIAKSKLPKIEDKWVGCMGSKPYLRGYPCGLWTLFHSLVVAQYESQPDLIGKGSQEVLEAIAGFIPRFFSCRECGQNFIKETVNLTEQVTDSRSAVLYLWRVHNNVNKRLHGASSEDPLHIKVFWPSPDICPGCYADGRNLKVGSAEKAIEKNVLAFMKRVYGRSNWLSGDHSAEIAKKFRDQKIIHKRLEFRKEAKKKQKIFDFKDTKLDSLKEELRRIRLQRSRDANRSVGGEPIGMDMSVCVLFSVLCSGIAVMLFCVIYTGRVRRKSIKFSVA